MIDGKEDSRQKMGLGEERGAKEGLGGKTTDELRQRGSACAVRNTRNNGGRWLDFAPRRVMHHLDT